MEQVRVQRKQFPTLSGSVNHEMWSPANHFDRDARSYQDMTMTPLMSQLQAAFELRFDEFQKIGVSCVDNGRSVCVSAPTSAGKTLMAEYAIQRALDSGHGVYFTTPLKALSNQKYDKLSSRFGASSIGLKTGDHTINADAPCLVVTTEILHRMLLVECDSNHKLHETFHKTRWVVFDEAHYIQDESRGHVWEETMMLLPDHVGMILLSATVPNIAQLAAWVATIKGRACHVVTLHKRPIRLQQYLFSGYSEFIRLPDAKNELHDKDIVQQACLKARRDCGLRPRWWEDVPPFKDSVRGETFTKGFPNLFQCLPHILQRLLDGNRCPVIVFSFSRRDVEIYASLAYEYFKSNNHPFLWGRWRRNLGLLIKEKLDKELKSLDMEMPFVKNVVEMLKNGIGMHHAGLLPQVKELVEIAFDKGYVKFLFATETFAQGVNSPARSVLLTEVRKFDGERRRLLKAEEFTHMKGRAGRRAKQKGDKPIDQWGNVYVAVSNDPKNPLDTGELHRLLYHPVPPMYSKYHLSAKMVLNTVNKDFTCPEALLQRSFLHFQATSPDLYPDHFAAFAKADINIHTIAHMQDKVEFVKNFLREKGFLNSEGGLTMKGTIAKDLDDFPLLEAELMFSPMRDWMHANNWAAALSLLLFSQGRGGSRAPDLPAAEQRPEHLRKIEQELRAMIKDYNDSFVKEFDFNVFCNSLEVSDIFPKTARPELMAAMEAWCNERHFINIYNMVNTGQQQVIHEGDIMKNMRKITEVLKKLEVVSTCMDDAEILGPTFAAARRNMFRGLAAGNSLYSDPGHNAIEDSENPDQQAD